MSVSFQADADLNHIIVKATLRREPSIDFQIAHVAKPKITTRFFSVEARYIVGGLFGEDTKRVKAVVRTNRPEVGMAAMAAYGFEEGTQEVVLEKDRPNAITMMLTTEIEVATVSVHILDATTQVELAALKNIPIEITI
jgi:hypothetical protein